MNELDQDYNELEQAELCPPDTMNFEQGERVE